VRDSHWTDLLAGGVERKEITPILAQFTLDFTTWMINIKKARIKFFLGFQHGEKF
jgi:hypothetical protein